jgi:hypothetical protein
VGEITVLDAGSGSGLLAMMAARSAGGRGGGGEGMVSVCGHV